MWHTQHTLLFDFDMMVTELKKKIVLNDIHYSVAWLSTNLFYLKKIQSN